MSLVAAQNHGFTSDPEAEMEDSQGAILALVS